MSAEPYIGEIMLFAGSYCPEGWMFCEGQTLRVNEHQALYAVIGRIYGGDEKQGIFNLPDLRGRAIVHQGESQGLPNRVIGSIGGVVEQKISLSEMPPHTHAIQTMVGVQGDSNSPVGKKLAAYKKVGTENYPYSAKDIVSDPMSQSAIGVTGEGQPVNNLPPYLILRYAIAIKGDFPPRD